MKKNEKFSNYAGREVYNEEGKHLRPVPLRVNPETIDDNRINEKRIVYVKIGAKKHPCIIELVTEEVYREYMRIEWAELKAEEREGRCLIPDGKGGLIMCPECNKCCGCQKVGVWDFSNNHPMHFDGFGGGIDEEHEDSNEDSFDVSSDESNDGNKVMADELADMIEAELRKDKPKYAVIFRAMYEGTLKPKEIAEKCGLKVSTTYEDVQKVMKKAQEIFSLLTE